jgi:diguanylate cyclase (GGDEF)-like protein
MQPDDTKPIHRILIIDDNSAIHEDFRKILVKQTQPKDNLEDMEALLFGTEVQTSVAVSSFEIDCASQGMDGLEMVKKAQSEGRPYSLAFVDGRMPPGWDGIETISHLWKESPDLQVVLCTAYADYSWQEIRKVLGDSDSLLILKKPFDNVEVLQLTHALTRKWELTREILGRLNQLAFYDHLTGLPNRALFMDRLTRAIDSARRYKHRGALLFIDLDNFKRINDTLGHSVGDYLLQAMSKRLLHSLRDSDTISRPNSTETAARLGGDEFTVILPIIEHQEDAGLVARRIEEFLARPIAIGNHEFIVTSSIGIAIFPDDGENVGSLLKNADLAMYFAKSKGPGSFKYYQESMNDSALKKLTIENELRQAIERDELQLHYQPQVDLVSGQLIGMEALLRWNNRELGHVPPIEFIPIAEESGLIIIIGDWVLRHACQKVQSWIEQGLFLERIAVNVSVKQFTHPDFVEKVETILNETGLDANRLEIEITESLLAHDIESIVHILQRLQDMNVRIAVDDFGTGYSSLSRLKDMPIDCLKIDRSFVCGIDNGGSDRSIIGAILAMAEGMGLRVIAEGVDSSSQINFLVGQKCREAQGYLFSRPLAGGDA